ncbi:unnamed protein product [Closterium sp. Yama58-4]|nr:unnamed protein product [Closterium sp. Yama58-4]
MAKALPRQSRAASRHRGLSSSRSSSTIHPSAGTIVASSMGNHGKAVRALLAIVAVIAACLPQPSRAVGVATAPASIATQMTINGRAFTFESRRCVNIPAMPGATKARVEVSQQQQQQQQGSDAGSDAVSAAACGAIRFFQDPGCSGQALDFLPVMGAQSVKYIPGVVTSALCLTETSRPATGTAAPSNNILESSSSSDADSESARVILESTLDVTDPTTGTSIAGVTDPSTSTTIAGITDPSTGPATAGFTNLSINPGGPAATDPAVPVVFTPGTFTNDAVNPTKSPEPTGGAYGAYGAYTTTTVPGY